MKKILNHMQKHRTWYIIGCCLIILISLLVLPVFFKIRNNNLYQLYLNSTENPTVIPGFVFAGIFYSSDYLLYLSEYNTFRMAAFFQIGFIWAIIISVLAVISFLLFYFKKNTILCWVLSILSFAWLLFSIYCPISLFRGEAMHDYYPGLGYILILLSSGILFFICFPKRMQKASKIQPISEPQNHVEELEKKEQER